MDYFTKNASGVHGSPLQYPYTLLPKVVILDRAAVMTTLFQFYRGD